MEYSSHKDLGRIFILRLDPGELLLESIEELASREGIDSAIVTSGIGTLSKFEYHRVINASLPTQNEFLTVEGPLEVLSLQGIIASGEPHLHAVCSDLESVYCGHVEEGCRTLVLIEASIVEIPGACLTRDRDPITGRSMLRSLISGSELGSN